MLVSYNRLSVAGRAQAGSLLHPSRFAQIGQGQMNSLRQILHVRIHTYEDTKEN